MNQSIAIVIEDSDTFRADIGRVLRSLAFETYAFDDVAPLQRWLEKHKSLHAKIVLLVSDLYDSHWALTSDSLKSDAKLIMRRIDAINSFHHAFPSAQIVIFSMLKNILRRIRSDAASREPGVDRHDVDILEELIASLKRIGVHETNILAKMGSSSEGSSTGLRQLRNTIEGLFERGLDEAE